MGQPMLVLDLVQTLIKLSGRSELEVAIHFTGLRQGEKLVEELFYRDENIEDTSFPKIKRVCGPRRDWEPLLKELEELEAALFLHSPEILRARLKEILPEYSYLADNDTKGNVESDSWFTADRHSVA